MDYQARFSRIKIFYLRHHRMPSYQELLKLFGVKSKNAAYKIVGKMIDKHLLTKDIHGHLIPSKYFREVPILGLVEAGFPSPAEEELGDTMSIDEYLIDNKDATYLLKVKGDSMIDAGIMPGDMVLVERGGTPKSGDIVIAEVDKEWTMKYFRKRGSKVYLEAANKKYKPIHPKEELNISAIVKSVIRKY
jgi:SOS regulatory protein LexA